jgi:hypothetical protein
MANSSHSGLRERELTEALRRKFKPNEGIIPHSEYDFLHEFGDTVSALLYGSLFSPEFIEVDGSILIDIDPSDRAREFLTKKPSGWCVAELEASFNFIEIPYIFANRDSSDQEDELLAKMVAESWQAKLNLKFPTRKFIVSALPPEQTGSVAGVQFYEER